MTTILTSSQVKQWALKLGVDLVGIAPAEPVISADKLNDYLRAGYYGEMHYLSRHVEERIDPRRLLPGARSVICVALNYYSEAPLVDEDSEKKGKEKKETRSILGRVARYAWFIDYHVVVKDRLRRLADKIMEAAGDSVQLRYFVDTAPLMEKAHAARAGLGWIGKNGLLINEKFGSWLVLGEIITNLKLDYDHPVSDLCGSCERCLRACPTVALAEPYILDARRCISYLTVESNAPIPEELAPKVGDWLFGCDACQESCPFNQNSRQTRQPEMQPRNQWRQLDLENIISMDNRQFNELFAGSTVARTRLEHLRRVACVCRDNLTG